MRVRFIENTGFILKGSTPDLPEEEALKLIHIGVAVPISNSHKSLDKPIKDKMIRKRKTK